TASEHSDKRRFTCFKFRSGNSRPAFGTKTAFVFSSPNAGCEVIMQLSARQSKRLCWHHDCGRESAARHLLAIATVTFEHHDRLCSNLVTNRAARAAAGEWNFHFWFSRLEFVAKL